MSPEPSSLRGLESNHGERNETGGRDTNDGTYPVAKSQQESRGSILVLRVYTLLQIILL